MRGHIDVRGRAIRGGSAVAMLLPAVALWTGLLGQAVPLWVSLVCYACAVMGLLGLVEAMMGICFLKAMGIKVPF